eukprot:scaffold36646_cov31-Phaeocystis_antarctica.AAC.1
MACARQVGSKWARGVVSRVFSSPKWLTVTLESGQTRPTQRDQVILDAPAPPDQLTPSALVLASSPPDLFWRKAELLEAEGEELHLAAGQLRLLPPPKPGPAKPEGGGIKRIRDRSGGGNAAPAKPAEPATAEPAPADDAPADPAPADEAPADPAPADEAPADDAPPEPKR